MNGEELSVPVHHQPILAALADKRSLASNCFDKDLRQDEALMQQLYGWYLAGYLQLME